MNKIVKELLYESIDIVSLLNELVKLENENTYTRYSLISVDMKLIKETLNNRLKELEKSDEKENKG